MENEPEPQPPYDLEAIVRGVAQVFAAQDVEGPARVKVLLWLATRAAQHEYGLTNERGTGFVAEAAANYHRLVHRIAAEQAAAARGDDAGNHRRFRKNYGGN